MELHSEQYSITITKQDSASQHNILKEQYDYIYDLREIQNEYLPELEERKAKKKGRPSKTVFIHRERSLYYARIQDIIKLCEKHRNAIGTHAMQSLFSIHPPDISY